MNANKLADELEQSTVRAEDHGTIAKRSKLASTVLRALQAELDSLRQDTTKPYESDYVKNVKLAAAAGEQG